MSRSRPPSRAYSTSRSTTAKSRAGGPTTDEGECLVAILQSRQGKEVAAIALNQELGLVVVTQFGDSATFVKTISFLKSNPPYAVLVPPSALPTADFGRARGEATLLVRCIRDEFPETAIFPVQRQYWDEQAGYEFLCQLSAKDHVRLHTIETTRTKHYALSSACALFKYLDTQGTAFSPHSLKIRYAPFEGTCLIDSDSAKNLELVQNVSSMLGDRSEVKATLAWDAQSLLYAFRHQDGKSTDRLARMDQILGRYEAVEELVYSEERLRSLRKALEPLKHIDLEKLTSKILSMTSSTRANPAAISTGRSSRSLLPKAGPDPSTLISQKLNHLLTLRTFLLSLASLRTSLENIRSSLLAQSREIIGDPRLDAMRQTVEDNVNKDLWSSNAPLGQKRGRGGAGDAGDAGGGETRQLTKASRLFVIRSDRKKFLDVARETYRENINDVNEYRDGLKVETGIDIALINIDNGEFLLQCSRETWAEGSPEVRSKFININEKGKNVKFSSLELQKRNARISESILEVLLLSDKILDEIFDSIRENVGCLYRCSEAISLLDMLASFAAISAQHEYVRPELTETLAIKSGRNPLHEQFRMGDGSFVPNDTYASLSSTFQIITGSNMSGKSTLLRQIALMHVMAQIGCFVPATYASFRPVSALLTRFSNDDNIEASLSTFAQEMTTMSMILGAIEVSARSGPCLVLVDELGRGTSPEEGIGIAHALAEEIIKSHSVCFFATHFKELSTTLARYPNVVSLHLETEIDRSQPDYSLSFHHRVVDGSDPLVHYGLELAKIVKLPTPVIDKAHLVSGTLEKLAEMKQSTSAAFQLQRRKQGILTLKGTLLELSRSNRIEGSTLLDMLREMKKETLELLQETQGVATQAYPEGSQDGGEFSEVVQAEGAGTPLDDAGIDEERDESRSDSPAQGYHTGSGERGTFGRRSEDQDEEMLDVE